MTRRVDIMDKEYHTVAAWEFRLNDLDIFEVTNAIGEHFARLLRRDEKLALSVTDEEDKEE